MELISIILIALLTTNGAFPSHEKSSWKNKIITFLFSLVIVSCIFFFVEAIDQT